MNYAVRSLVGISLLVVLAACYHATIDMGRPASPQVVEDQWADGWVLGLVPPKTVEVAGRCPNGVAKVETHLSFVNQLVGFLTIGIYTPMSIKVTCAASGSGAAGVESADITIDADASIEEQRQAFTGVAALALNAGKPIWVEIR